MSSVDAASMAPVCPAEMAALALPSATCRQATTIDASGLLRTARTPSSAEWMRSLACTTVIPLGTSPCVASSRSSASESPTRRIPMPSFAAATAPATGTCGAVSPPIASTATTGVAAEPLTGGGASGAGVDDRATLVMTAHHAHMVGHHGSRAARAAAEARGRHRVGGTTLVTACAGCLALGDCQCGSSIGPVPERRGRLAPLKRRGQAVRQISVEIWCGTAGSRLVG